MKMIFGLMFLLSFSCSFAKNLIHDYQRIFFPVYTPGGDLRMAIRVFKMNEVPSFLVVDPNTLETKVAPIMQFSPRNISQNTHPGYFTQWGLASTRYYQRLNQTTAPPYLFENQGLKHVGTESGKGNVLSIDMCPSIKPFEADFFNQLVNLSKKMNKPVPITIAISGLWLIKHPEEFEWLLSQEKQKTLAIIWANHSFSHAYYFDLPYSENFLLAYGSNLEAEILLTEKYLLEAGETPSVFFRFPGLISNETWIKQLKLYGLIPLGTDAWLANLEQRHETISPGSIILVHGNGNEHDGIVKALPLLDKLSFLDLKEAA